MDPAPPSNEYQNALDRVTREIRALARRPALEHTSWSGAKAAMIEAARALRSATKQDRPPIELDTMLQLRKITGKSYFNSVDSPEAVLVPTLQGFIIRLRPGLHSSRIKFSEAHELAHTFFYDIEQSPPKRLITRAVPTLARAKEEGLCNDFAAELLLPIELLRKGLDEFRGVATWDIVQRLKKRFDVSTEVVTRKLLSECVEFQYCVAIHVDQQGEMRKWLGSNMKSMRLKERLLIEQVSNAFSVGGIVSVLQVANAAEELADVKARVSQPRQSAIIWLDFARSRNTFGPKRTERY